MASESDQGRCIKCDKEKCIVKCCGCSQTYCYNHFEKHREELKGKLDELTVSRDSLQQTLIEQKNSPDKHSLMQKLDEWERRSIEKIRQVADEVKQSLLKNINLQFVDTERKLNELTAQLRRAYEENDFFESDLQHWEEKLTKLTEKINGSSTDIILRQSTPLVNNISVDTTCECEHDTPLLT